MAVKYRQKSDVIVSGGGPAGIIAAIAAARTGVRTLLIEQNGYVGGVAAMGLPLQGLYTNSEELIVKGIAWEMVARLLEMGSAAVVRNVGVGGKRGRGSAKFNACWISFHPEAYKFVALEMLHEAGVELMLHTYVSDVLMDNNVIKGLIVENKSGRVVVPGDRIVDCTGDGDIPALAGAPFEKGKDGDERILQPMTMTFTMSQVNLGRAQAEEAAIRLPHEVVEGAEIWRSPGFGSYDVQLSRWSKELQREIPEFAHILTEVNIKDLRDGIYYGGNMVHIPGLDGSDGDELSRAEDSSRRLVWRLGQFMKKYLPGFENSFMINTSARIGVRETRRIIGDYYLTYEDIVQGKQFDDVVTLGGYRVDIHGYDGGPVYHEPGTGTQVKDFGYYDIPYRCLVPQKIENLLIAGRCLSASHEAQGSARVMGTAMGMGHAVGVAAALSVQEGIIPRELNTGLIQETLLDQGANLGARFS